eukprot:TRINITY_DN60692_c0_g1_i1.p1 TRINITY_DN60692_c0_g1~~TRINITY_DN60692_c0_g1_i1.p1  ORF type:complete len:1034 (-),score=120.05 TRINITY_DN60692_c0_g1_i1:79-2850(-)
MDDDVSSSSSADAGVPWDYDVYRRDDAHLAQRGGSTWRSATPPARSRSITTVQDYTRPNRDSRPPLSPPVSRRDPNGHQPLGMHNFPQNHHPPSPTPQQHYSSANRRVPPQPPSESSPPRMHPQGPYAPSTAGPGVPTPLPPPIGQQYPQQTTYAPSQPHPAMGPPGPGGVYPHHPYPPHGHIPTGHPSTSSASTVPAEGEHTATPHPPHPIAKPPDHPVITPAVNYPAADPRAQARRQAKNQEIIESLRDQVESLREQEERREAKQSEVARLRTELDKLNRYKTDLEVGERKNNVELIQKDAEIGLLRNHLEKATSQLEVLKAQQQDMQHQVAQLTDRQHGSKPTSRSGSPKSMGTGFGGSLGTASAMGNPYYTPIPQYAGKYQPTGVEINNPPPQPPPAVGTTQLLPSAAPTPYSARQTPHAHPAITGGLSARSQPPPETVREVREVREIGPPPPQVIHDVYPPVHVQPPPSELVSVYPSARGVGVVEEIILDGPPPSAVLAAAQAQAQGRSVPPRPLRPQNPPSPTPREVLYRRTPSPASRAVGMRRNSIPSAAPVVTEYVEHAMTPPRPHVAAPPYSRSRIVDGAEIRLEPVPVVPTKPVVYTDSMPPVEIEYRLLNEPKMEVEYRVISGGVPPTTTTTTGATGTSTTTTTQPVTEGVRHPTPTRVAPSVYPVQSTSTPEKPVVANPQQVASPTSPPASTLYSKPIPPPITTEYVVRSGPFGGGPAPPIITPDEAVRVAQSLRNASPSAHSHASSHHSQPTPGRHDFNEEDPEMVGINREFLLHNLELDEGIEEPEDPNEASVDTPLVTYVGRDGRPTFNTPIVKKAGKRMDSKNQVTSVPVPSHGVASGSTGVPAYMRATQSSKTRDKAQMAEKQVADKKKKEEYHKQTQHLKKSASNVSNTPMASPPSARPRRSEIL